LCKMTKKSSTPAIRFKGFTDTWEQRKLCDVVKEISRNDPESEAPIMMITANNGFIEQSERYAFNNAGESLKKYILLKKGELAYNHGASKLRPYGSCFALTTAENARIPFVYHCFSAENQNAEFMSIELNGAEIENQLRKIVSSGARMDGLLNISFDEYTSVSVLLPGTEEQDCIADFFRQLDDLITLHQRKYDKLTNVKKSMLEKMFPKNGSNVPEIRFKGFTEAWEQRKLGDIYGSIGNAFVGTATPYYAEQGHFYLESNNVKDGQINHNSEIFINDEFYEKQKDKWLHTGDMVMVQSGHVGHAAVIPEELDDTAAHALIMFRNPKEEIEPYFLNYEYQTDKTKKKIEHITTGNTIKHILASDMQEFVVDLPKFEEQKVIAGYFCNIDNLITLHQRELEKLKNLKKACLEKMFV